MDDVAKWPWLKMQLLIRQLEHNTVQATSLIVREVIAGRKSQVLVDPKIWVTLISLN